MALQPLLFQNSLNLIESREPIPTTMFLAAYRTIPVPYFSKMLILPLGTDVSLNALKKSEVGRLLEVGV